MTVIGIHASHEQVHPAALLRTVVRAEQAGFTAGMCSDHFAPWGEQQGHSGFAWAWLGAALQATALPFGAVSAPGQRYHPAIIAQALATLAAMYEGRVWVALGSGEALNEHITGERWPRKDIRNARLAECVAVIRALLAGEEVTHDGLVTVDRARLWTRPQTPPKLIAPAVSAETAEWAASWADGLITINQPHPTLRTMIERYRLAGGRGLLAVQVHLCWAPSAERARALAYEQWKTNVFAPPVCWDLETPEAFQAAAAHVRPEDIDASVAVSADLGWHTQRLHELIELGFEEIYLHQVGGDQAAFVDAFGDRVLPQLPTGEKN